MPKPDLTTRIIANEFQAKTYSPTSFDLPLRKDVIQTQIPTSITRTFEETHDPRHPKKVPVTVVKGILYHGTGSNDAKVVHGIETNFMQTNDVKVTQSLQAKEQGLAASKQTFNTASAVLNSITNNLAGSPHMILKADLTNKREQPDLKVHEKNEYKLKRLEELKNTPAGVRAAHSPRKLG